MKWNDVNSYLEPFIVRISTPETTGTGFLLTRAGSNPQIVGIATAAHVVMRAHAWGQPIRIEHHATGYSTLLQPTERAILTDQHTDTATIVMASSLPLPENTLILSPERMSLRIGNEVGWLGFPALAPQQLCFFKGSVSSYIESTGQYLIDGVAINGVSGGPAAAIIDDKLVHIFGVVTEYRPNQSVPGLILPGLSVIQDLRQLYETVREVNSIEQAKSIEQPAAEVEIPLSNEGLEKSSLEENISSNNSDSNKKVAKSSS